MIVQWGIVGQDRREGIAVEIHDIAKVFREAENDEDEGVRVAIAKALALVFAPDNKFHQADFLILAGINPIDMQEFFIHE